MKCSVRRGPTRRWLEFSAMASLLTIIPSCYNERSPSEPPFEASLDVQLRESLQTWGLVLPIAEIPAQNPALVDLGRALFFDKTLSGNRDVSCATCHDLANHTGDGMSLAVGTGGIGTGSARVPGPGHQFVPRNAPSLLNQALMFPYVFWDGRLAEFNRLADSSLGVQFPSGLSGVIAMQAMLPVLNRGEMRGQRGDRDRFGNLNELAEFSDNAATEIWAAAMRRLLGINDYVAKFNAAFPGIPTTQLGFQHAANAIAVFELDAFTKTSSLFDRFLKGETRAMSDEAKRGGILFFRKALCAQCHSGPLLGGQQFANIGVPQLGPGVGKAAPLDRGRGEQFGAPAGVVTPYDFAFRVPPLRNVELTAPYMHNGAYPNLEAVVRHYTNADSALKNYDVSQLDPSLRSTHHGDAATIATVSRSMDFRVRQGIKLTPLEQQQLVAFLKSLTDPSAHDLSAIAPAAVPSGLPVRE
jgi:cytochrome c peroxidase